ncbi:MAG: hypothetical protein IT335_01495 [Thermomicrobiales bacterium]|nr:hypothetical protein [Thermomicrobiales bacterium]
MNTARPAGVLAHGGRGLFDWLTGTGFLALNALAFFVGLVILVPWNIYSSPGDFWTADLFIPWAFLLGFHALLVSVWALIRHVILKDDNPLSSMPASARQWQAARAYQSSSSIDFRTPSTPNPAATSAASALYAEEWSRQTIIEHTPAPPPSQPTPPSPSLNMEALLADWDTSWPDPDDVVTAAEPVEAAVEPESAVPDEEASVLQETVVARTPGPLAAAARAASQDDSGIDPELEWQWIEAAASAWLTRRESQTAEQQYDRSAPAL